MRKLRLDSSACLLGALCLMILPLDWLLSAVIAAALHEAAHCAAIALTGGKIYGVRIGVGGTVIETQPMGRVQELLCALAGPLGSLFLLLFIRWIPRIALCAAVQGLFNLFPIFPLDGGRVLRSATGLLLPPDRAENVSRYLETGTVIAVFVCAAVLAVRFQLGIAPLILALILTAKAILRKIPCKPAKLGVQ